MQQNYLLEVIISSTVSPVALSVIVAAPVAAPVIVTTAQPVTTTNLCLLKKVYSNMIKDKYLTYKTQSKVGRRITIYTCTLYSIILRTDTYILMHIDDKHMDNMYKYRTCDFTCSTEAEMKNHQIATNHIVEYKYEACYLDI